jgi:hypothetical protein
LWLDKNNFPRPSKSACLGCPYHDDKFWHDLKSNSPEEFAEACAVDRKIRKESKGVVCEAFLHRSLKPLSEVDSEPGKFNTSARLKGLDSTLSFSALFSQQTNIINEFHLFACIARPR